MKNGKLNGLLIVCDSGESTLLETGDGLATGDDGGENVALHGNTQGQGYDVEQEEVGGIGRGSLAGEDTSLDSGTVGDGLIGVDRLLKLLAVKKVGQQLLDLGNTGRATDEDDLINGALLNGSILEDLGNGVQSASEGLGVEVLETGTSDGQVEVLTVEEGVDLDSSLGTAGKGTLGTLASSPETTKGTGITAQVLLGLARELLLAVVEQVGVEVLATQVGVTSGGADSEDTTLDVKEGYIESTTTKIVDQNVTLLVGLVGAETVGNGGSSRLVDDTEDVKTRDGSSILGGLTLVVIEVGGDSDDSLLDLLAQLDLGNLLHLLAQGISVCLQQRRGKDVWLLP